MKYLVMLLLCFLFVGCSAKKPTYDTTIQYNEDDADEVFLAFTDAWKKFEKDDECQGGIIMDDELRRLYDANNNISNTSAGKRISRPGWEQIIQDCKNSKRKAGGGQTVGQRFQTADALVVTPKKGYVSVEGTLHGDITVRYFFVKYKFKGREMWKIREINIF